MKEKDMNQYRELGMYITWCVQKSGIAQFAAMIKSSITLIKSHNNKSNPIEGRMSKFTGIEHRYTSHCKIIMVN